MQEINLSLGSAGEWRYPSYNAHDGKVAAWPSSGAIQAYSPVFVSFFQEFMREIYENDIQKVRNAWNNPHLENFEAIFPPNFNSNSAETWIEELGYQSQYGTDFFAAYHLSLVNAGEKQLNLFLQILKAFGPNYHGIPIGIKIPGVHWTFSHPKHPRLAEIKAGLIHPLAVTRQDPFLGYGSVMQIVKEFREQNLYPVNLHFTCLEMDNQEDCHPTYSRPLELVQGFLTTAKMFNLPVKGENALGHLLHHQNSWRMLNRSIIQGFVEEANGAVRLEHGYSGLTILRLENLTDPAVLQNAAILRTIAASHDIAKGVFPSSYANPINCETLFSSVENWVRREAKDKK